jgi:hypothetical protein
MAATATTEAVRDALLRLGTRFEGLAAGVHPRVTTGRAEGHTASPDAGVDDWSREPRGVSPLATSVGARQPAPIADLAPAAVEAGQIGDGEGSFPAAGNGAVNDSAEAGKLG